MSVTLVSNCVCGQPAKITASSLDVNISCERCRHGLHRTFTQDAIKAWNDVMEAIKGSGIVSTAPKAAPDLSVIVSFRNDVNDYVVRVGTMAQIDKPMPVEISSTCYRADRVHLNASLIQDGARRYRNAPAFIAWMAQGGVNLERVQ